MPGELSSTFPDVLVRAEKDEVNLNVAAGSLKLPEETKKAFSVLQDATCSKFSLHNIKLCYFVEEHECNFEDPIEETMDFVLDDRPYPDCGSWPGENMDQDQFNKDDMKVMLSLCLETLQARLPGSHVLKCFGIWTMIRAMVKEAV